MTEVIMDNLAPTWVTSFDVQYHFERRETYKAEVYDVDDEGNVANLAGHDYVGSLEFSVHEVVTSRDQTLIRPLINTQRAEGKSGIIKVTGEERVVGSQEECSMQLRCTFPSMAGYKFFLIHKQVTPTIWKPIYKSEIQQATQGAYTWNNLNILTNDMAGDDVDKEIRVEFYLS